MKKAIAMLLIVLGTVTATQAQSQTREPAMCGKSVEKTEKPAAQGYLKGQPSNRSQDKQLKELEKMDRPKSDSKPQPKEAPKEPKGPNASLDIFGTATEMLASGGVVGGGFRDTTLS